MEKMAGFYYPVIDDALCIQCGMCARACPTIAGSEKHNTGDGLISYCTDSSQITRSSSGGIAYALAKCFIADGGIVFGAAYNDDMRVEHIKVDNAEQLYRLQGSKYSQSSIGFAFIEAKKELALGKMVLFFGTPCQISGLLSCVRENLRENLYTCDILCGGVPSPVLFEKYIKYLSNKYSGGITDLNFRSKKYGYSYGYLHALTTDNGTEKLLYGIDSAFVKTLGAGYVRPSCFLCNFIDVNRVSDITLGDYAAESHNNENGISSVIISTEKGKKLISLLSDIVVSESVNISQITSSQYGALQSPRKKPEDYELFFKETDESNWEQIYTKHLKPRSFKMLILDYLPPYILTKIKNILSGLR